MIDKFFVCIGAQKAGTSWFYEQVKNHPDLCLSPYKEIHYFDYIHLGSEFIINRKLTSFKHLMKAGSKVRIDGEQKLMVNFRDFKKALEPIDDNHYINLFNKPEGRLCTDITPNYSILPRSGFKHFKSISKSQKILFILRDPVDRSLSSIKYFYQGNKEDINKVEEEEFLLKTTKERFLVRSRYEIPIKHLWDLFKHKNIKIVYYEDLMEDKQNGLDEICDFLEISKLKIPQSKLNKRVNATKSFEFSDNVKAKLKVSLEDTYKFMYENFDNIPDSWVKL